MLSSQIAVMLQQKQIFSQAIHSWPISVFCPLSCPPLSSLPLLSKRLQSPAMRLPVVEQVVPSHPGFETGPRSIGAVRVLRISVTDRCNFRCVYCMPEEGVRWLPREDILDFEEVCQIVR